MLGALKHVPLARKIVYPPGARIFLGLASTPGLSTPGVEEKSWIASQVLAFVVVRISSVTPHVLPAAGVTVPASMP